MEGMGMQLIMAAVMIGMVVYMWPRAKHQLEHGRKGSSKEWMTVAMLIGAVMLFVFILVKAV